MPPEISQWDRNEFLRERKNERVSNGNAVGSRWRDRDIDNDVRVYRDRHWASNQFPKRPNGYGKQGRHMHTEDFARGPGPSRPNKRFFDDGSCLLVEKYGRDRSMNIRGGSFSQRDWRGNFWDAAPGPRSNGCAKMPAHASMKRSADDMLAYNSYPHSNIGNNWGQFHFKDQHYNNSIVSGQHTRRKFSRKNSVGLNARKPLKCSGSGSLCSRGSGFSHSSSPRSLGLDSGDIKGSSHLQNSSPVHSHSGNSATCATVAASEETNSRGCDISHSSSTKRLHSDFGEIKVPLHHQDLSLVPLSGNPAACETSAPAEEKKSSGCGFNHLGSPKSSGLDSGEIKVPSPPHNLSSGHFFSGKAAACATYAPAEEINLRKKPRLGWGEGLAQFEKIINESTDSAENDGMIESLQSHCKNYTESIHSHNSNMALRSPGVQCFTECLSPVTASVARCSSPGEDQLFVRAVGTSNLCSFPCPESQNQRDGSTFNLENLEVTGLANFSSSLSESLYLDNLHSVVSDCMRSCEMSKLLVLKADIAKKIEITESEIDLLENELKTLISDTGNASPCSTSSSSLPLKFILNPSEEFNLIARPAPLGPNCSGDMMEMSPGGLEGELAESRDVDIDSLGTATSKVAEPLLAGTLLSEKTHKYGESTWNADRGGDEDREEQSIVYAVKEKNSGAIFSKHIARSRECMLPVDVTLHREHMSYDLLIASNKDSAHRAANVFSKLLPTNLLVVDHPSFDFSPCWKKKALVRENLALRKRFLRFKERVITLKYKALKQLWKEDMLCLFTSRSHLMSQKKFEMSSPVVYRSNPKQRSFIHAPFSSRARSLSLVPTAEVINFASKLLENSSVKIYRGSLKMPSLILDNREKIASRFISNNGLVEDPFTAEKERCMFNPWTSKEKEIFVDRLATLGKDFRKIASFLDHKTTADCIEFYYKNHKSDYFQRTKKKTEFLKQGKSCSTNTFLVTSGKRRDIISNSSSIDMLGAASVIAAHVGERLTDQQKCPRTDFGTSNPKPWGDDGNRKKSCNPDVLGNERESIAADVLAGICGSFSSEAMSSCITSFMDFREGCQEKKSLQLGSLARRPLTPEGTHNVVSETCSDESCVEIDPINWTDEEKSSFIQAVTSYGKDFTMISQYVRTRTSDQCKVFFSKARKCLGLDTVMHSNQHIPAIDDSKGGGGSDNGNACVVETICNEKSGSRIPEDQLLTNFKEILTGSQAAGTKKTQPDFDQLEEHKRMKKLDVEDIEGSSDNLVSSNHAEEKAELDLDTGGNIVNCHDRVTLTVQDIKGKGCSDTSRTENVGHGISIPSCSLSGKRVGFADVTSSSMSVISCAIQGTKTTSSDERSFLAVGKNSSAKGVVGGENKNAKLLNTPRKRLDQDMAQQFDSGKFSNKQFQNSVRTGKYHKPSCENLSLDPVSIMTVNGINGNISCTKPVSARSKSNVVKHFSAQPCLLQKCNSSKQHLDPESELHRLSQNGSKDHPGMPKLQCSSDSNKPRDSDVKVFGKNPGRPPNCRLPDDHSGVKVEGSFKAKFSANQNMDGTLASSKFDRSSNLGIENHPVRSNGFRA